jgi:hypothetical protein
MRTGSTVLLSSVVLASALLAVACGPGPTSTPGSSVDGMPTSASVVEDGVLVSIRLDRNPLVAGLATWVTTEVRNVGSDDLIWFHDGCETSVDVWGTVEEASWRPGRGQEAALAAFKTWALESSGADKPVTVYFTPKSFIDQGRIGCADVGISDTVEPGGSLVQRAQWDGMARWKLGPPPAGPVQLVGRFGFYWRKRQGEPERITDQVIEVPLVSRVVEARDPALLDPGEVVDAALADPRFAAWVTAQPHRSGADAILRVAPDGNGWWVGLLSFLGDGAARLHVVVVDPRTGAIRRTIDRDWSLEAEGYL